MISAFHKPITKLVITTEDGDRTITWSGCAPDPASIADDIEDVLHWPVGASSLFQAAGQPLSGTRQNE